MNEEGGAAVRPAGAPMVPMPRPSGSGPKPDGTTARAAEAVAPVVERAKEAGGEVAQEARRRAAEELDRRTTQAGERMAGTAADLREVANELRHKGKDGPARLADQAATRIERVGAYLRDADMERLAGDLARAGRRRPAALVLGTAAVGIIAGRLLKASGPTRSGARGGSQRSGEGR
jgi:hypothetical protein